MASKAHRRKVGSVFTVNWEQARCGVHGVGRFHLAATADNFGGLRWVVFMAGQGT